MIVIGMIAFGFSSFDRVETVGGSEVVQALPETSPTPIPPERGTTNSPVDSGQTFGIQRGDSQRGESERGFRRGRRTSERSDYKIWEVEKEFSEDVFTFVLSLIHI